MLSALENVALPLVLDGEQKRRQPQRPRLAAEGRPGDRLAHRPSELSGGQQQRVALARALVTEPAVILADEPTGNLDSRGAEEMLRLLRRTVDDWGRTVVMVTHDPRMAAYADRIIFMKDGTVVDDTHLGVANTVDQCVIEKMEADHQRRQGRAGRNGRRPAEVLISMNAYLTIPARYLLGRKLRTVLTTLAVVFGVMVVFAVNMLLPTITAALNASVMGATGQVDLTVSSATGETVRPADAGRRRGPSPASPPRARCAPGQSDGADGATVEVIGVDPATRAIRAMLPGAAGRFLTASDTQVAVLSQALAQALGVNVGDNVQPAHAAGRWPPCPWWA